MTPKAPTALRPGRSFTPSGREFKTSPHTQNRRLWHRAVPCRGGHPEVVLHAAIVRRGCKQSGQLARVKQREWKKSRYDRGGTRNCSPGVTPWAIFCRPDRVGTLDIQFNDNYRSGIIRLRHASSRTACDTDRGVPQKHRPPAIVHIFGMVVCAALSQLCFPFALAMQDRIESQAGACRRCPKILS